MVKTSTPSILTASKKKQKPAGTQSPAFDPSDAVIASILSYSKALSVKKSKSMGYVENLLN